MRSRVDYGNARIALLEAQANLATAQANLGRQIGLDQDAGPLRDRGRDVQRDDRDGSHKFGLGFQDMNGDTGFAYIDGSDPFLVNFVQINDFANADERSWQARYDYNFASIGVPGLTFMTRYISGDNVQRSAPGEGSVFRARFSACARSWNQCSPPSSGLYTPQSQTMTSPAPYCPGGITPSKEAYS